MIKEVKLPPIPMWRKMLTQIRKNGYNANYEPRHKRITIKTDKCKQYIAIKQYVEDFL